MKPNLLFYAALLSALVFTGCGSSDTTSTPIASTPSPEQPAPGQPSDSDLLSEDQKYSLAYMWHEEKLAKEIYLELNPTSSPNTPQLPYSSQSPF